MRIKVCGITSIDQMHQLGDLGVQFAGMIFYPPSPRYVFKHGLKAEDIRLEKVKPYKIGVFVNSKYDEVMKVVDAFGLDMVQLHGDETPYQCEKIANYIQVIKAFRFADGDHVEWTIKDYYNCTDMFMFDTGVTEKKDAAQYGGTGRKFNWNRLKGLSVNKPFFLSGGIEPTDAENVKAFMKDKVAKDLFAVDINSRFESSPGVKDMQLVKKFIGELNVQVSDTTK
jgi:phosphoribosylanthranilate isomerase